MFLNTVPSLQLIERILKGNKEEKGEMILEVGMSLANSLVVECMFYT